MYYVLAVAAAIALYVLRTTFRRAYGVLEILIGLFLVYLAMHTSGSFSSDFASDFDVVRTTVKMTTYLAAVFAMVRGLDNIFHSLQIGRR